MVVEIINIDYVLAHKPENDLPVCPDLDGVKILEITL
jgi:hypothetical protein